MTDRYVAVHWSDIPTPPCELGCPYLTVCSRHVLACADYQAYVSSEKKTRYTARGTHQRLVEQGVPEGRAPTREAFVTMMGR